MSITEKKEGEEELVELTTHIKHGMRVRHIRNRMRARHIRHGMNVRHRMNIRHRMRARHTEIFDSRESHA